MEKYNVFYFVDENNKRESMLKKFSSDKPPSGCKIYYKKKDTNERVATDPTKIRNQFDQKLN